MQDGSTEGQSNVCSLLLLFVILVSLDQWDHHVHLYQVSDIELKADHFIILVHIISLSMSLVLTSLLEGYNVLSSTK